MRITPDQLRAARSLLNLSQEDLAAASGAAITGLRQFELGKSQTLQAKTEKKLMAYLTARLELIGDRGVALRREDIQYLEGADALPKLLGHIASHIQPEDDELLLCYADPAHFPPEAAEAWQKLIDGGVCCRCLHATSTAPYALKAIYGPFVAQMVAVQSLVVHFSPLLADTERHAFEAIWQTLPHESEAQDGEVLPFRRKQHIGKI